MSKASEILKLLDSKNEKIPPGLLGWVKDYQEARKFGNVKLAKQIKKNIDAEIKKLKLDPDEVYFHFGDPDIPS